jgi:hypothetical protein
MNEIIANIGESLQGMKGPDVLLLIACILAIPVALSIIVLNMVKTENRRRELRARARAEIKSNRVIALNAFKRL